MREIKFRAWDKDKNEMLFYDGIFNRKPYTEKSTFPQYESCPKYHELELMQYTELKDKNGVEIYEGDVLEIHDGLNTKAIIVFDQGCAAFQCKYIGESASSDHLFGAELCEVIGNIYENGDLLND